MILKGYLLYVHNKKDTDKLTSLYRQLPLLYYHWGSGPLHWELEKQRLLTTIDIKTRNKSHLQIINFALP